MLSVTIDNIGKFFPSPCSAIVIFYKTVWKTSSKYFTSTGQIWVSLFAILTNFYLFGSATKNCNVLTIFCQISNIDRICTSVTVDNIGKFLLVAQNHKKQRNGHFGGRHNMLGHLYECNQIYLGNKMKWERAYFSTACIFQNWPAQDWLLGGQSRVDAKHPTKCICSDFCCSGLQPQGIPLTAKIIG